MITSLINSVIVITGIVIKDIRAPHQTHVHTEPIAVFSYHHQSLLEQVSWLIRCKLAFP